MMFLFLLLLNVARGACSNTEALAGALPVALDASVVAYVVVAVDPAAVYADLRVHFPAAPRKCAAVATALAVGVAAVGGRRSLRKSVFSCCDRVSAE